MANDERTYQHEVIDILGDHPHRVEGIEVASLASTAAIDAVSSAPVLAITEVDDTPLQDIAEVVAAHVAEVDPARTSVAELLDLSQVPAWLRAALLARFAGQGLTIESRMQPEVFAAALHEAQHGAL